ncbi:hypothetical protein Tco_0169588 [Tanacetum coccineum]
MKSKKSTQLKKEQIVSRFLKKKETFGSKKEAEGTKDNKTTLQELIQEHDDYYPQTNGSELGSELTFLAGSELKTSELDTSELKTSEYSELQVFEDLYTSELGKETLPIVFLASELSSLYPASYRVASCGLLD